MKSTSTTSTFLVVLTISLLSAASTFAQTYRVEKASTPLPADALSPHIAALLDPTGLRVVRGTNSTHCEIWLCKQWTGKTDFTPTSEVLYPFESGQLVGAIRFRRRRSDFRNQEIDSGVYTLRYGQQPIDGNHEGTSPTRDFLLLVKGEADTAAEPIDEEQLMEFSSEAVGTAHPGMLCMQRVQGDVGVIPSVRHDELNDWWILRLAGKVVDGDQTQELVVDLVVVGHAAE